MGVFDCKGIMTCVIVMPLATQRGGSEMLLMHLLRARVGTESNESAPRVKYEIVFLENGPLVEKAKSMGYVVWVAPAGRLRSIFCVIRTILRLRRVLARGDIGAVLSWMPKAHLYVAPAAIMAGVPFLWWQHGITAGKWMDRLVTFLPSKRVICCSQAAAVAQQQLFPTHATSVVYPAVELDQFRPGRMPSREEARRLLGLPQGCPIVGAVARLQSQKGIPVLLDAAAIVSRDNAQVRFVVVGGVHSLEPEHGYALKRQTERLDLSKRILFAGHQENVALWMQAMDIVVLPSIEPEGFGMVLVEAMALGKLVIATALGGPLEIIENGVNGMLVAPGDTVALASGILEYLKYDATHPQIKCAARRRAEHFDTETLAESVARELTDVVAMSGRNHQSSLR